MSRISDIMRGARATEPEDEIDLGGPEESQVVKHYRDLSNFIKYMQKRMDFIAQVTTSPPSWCFSTGWDELLGTFARQTCLTENIIRSHHELLANGDKDFIPGFRFWLDDREVTLAEMSKDSPKVDIPHAQIGAHAFYTILENLVRNAAKYGDRQQLRQMKACLSFDIRLEEKWRGGNPEWMKEFYRVSITDNLRLTLPRVASASERNVVADLNNYLSRPIIDPETMMLMPGSWGMKEIKICAAYLRMINQERIDDTFNRLRDGTKDLPPIIAAQLANRTPDGLTGNLSFVFYLLRSKKAIIAEQEKSKEKGAPPELFRREGIDFVSPKWLRMQVERAEVLRHSFLVIWKKSTQESWDWKWLSSHINYLPHRIIVIGQESSALKEWPDLQQRVVFVRSTDFDRAKPLESPDRLMTFLWEHWTTPNWRDYVLCVRWSNYQQTRAEVGGTESWDGPEVGGGLSRWLVHDERRKLTRLDRRRCLVYDHRQDPDDTDLFRESAFHHSFSSSTDTVEMLQLENPNHIKEAAALTVVVIDERIWMERDSVVHGGVAAKYKYDENKTLSACWRKRRVYIQDTDQVLSDFPAVVRQLRADVPHAGPAAGDRQAHGAPSKMYDFLIIHQTIIDSLRSRNEKEFKANWAELKRLVRWVVIDTGRGQPEQARSEKLRWVEYSNLAECLVAHPGDKFRLAQLLSRLRASSAKGV